MAVAPSSAPAIPAAPTAFDALAIARRVLTLEAAALQDMAVGLGPEFARAVDRIAINRGRVICAGIGKSGHVARKIASTFASIGAPSFFLHPAEAAHGDLGMVGGEDILLCLSKSGETPELAPLLSYARRFAVLVIAITAGMDSSLAKTADIVLLLPDSPEACAETQAPTTSSTLMTALGDCLAVALIERRGFRARDFRNLHPGGRLGTLLMQVQDVMHGGSEIPALPASARLAEGLDAISRGHLGCVLIVHPDGKLAGIVTDGDVRRAFAAGRRAETIGDLMNPAPVMIPPDLQAGAALKLLSERGISQVIVAEHDRPVGVVHLHDLLRAGIA